MRKKLDFKGLLAGKISLQDIVRPEIYSILNYEGQLLPSFMDDMEEYMRCLDEIAKTNHIDEVDEEDPAQIISDQDNDQMSPVGDRIEMEEIHDDDIDQVDVEEEIIEKDSPAIIPQQEAQNQNQLTEHNKVPMGDDHHHPVEDPLTESNPDKFLQEQQ